MPYKDPQKEKEAKKASYLRHKEKTRLKNREWKRRHKELLRERERGPTKKCARCGQKPWADFKDGRAQVCEDCRHKTPEWLIRRRQKAKEHRKLRQEEAMRFGGRAYTPAQQQAMTLAVAGRESLTAPELSVRARADSTNLSPKPVRSVSSGKVSQTKPKKLNKRELEAHEEAKVFDREMRRMKKEALQRRGLA